METAARLQGPFFLHISQISQISLNKENFSLLSKAVGKERPSMFPKSGASVETDAHFQSLCISFGVPSKGAIPPGSPYRALSERDAPLLEPSFIHLAKSPVYEPLPGSPAGPQWREMPYSRAFLYTSARVPIKDPPPGSPHRAPSERDAPLPRALFIRFSKSLVNEPHFQVPQRGPYGERCPSPEPFLHNL